MIEIKKRELEILKKKELEIRKRMKEVEERSKEHEILDTLKKMSKKLGLQKV